MTSEHKSAAPFTFFGAGRENASLADILSGEIARVMATNQILNGPDVFAFEERIAKISGRKHAVAVSSATDALFFALQAHGISDGDEVLVPAYSFAASASGILRSRATPVFVDIALPHATLDLEDAERRITPATKAIIWVGLFGGLVDPAPIEAFARKHDLVLIEDAAQSFSAAWDGKAAGGIGHAATFSFDRNKVLGAPGTGGALVTDDDDIAARVRSLRYHGKDGADFAELGYNSQMSGVTAAVLNTKLDYHDVWRAKRDQIALAYDAALADQPVQLLTWDKKCTHARHKYVFVTEDREAWEAHLKGAGIPTRVHYDTPLQREPVFAKYAQNHLPCPVADQLSQTALSLPIYAQLTEAELDRVTTALRSFPNS